MAYINQLIYYYVLLKKRAGMCFWVKSSRRSREFLLLVIHDYEFFERLYNLWYTCVDQLILALIFLFWGYFGLKKLDVKFSCVFFRYKDIHKTFISFVFSLWIISKFLNTIYYFLFRRKFNAQQSKVNLLKVTAKSPPHSAASAASKSPEPRKPRYNLELHCIHLV